MQLADFITSPQHRESIAAAAGTTPDYLWQIESAWNGRRPSPELARRIVAATGGVVTLTDLRPDIWPESEAA